MPTVDVDVSTKAELVPQPGDLSASTRQVPSSLVHGPKVSRGRILRRASIRDRLRLGGLHSIEKG